MNKQINLAAKYLIHVRLSCGYDVVADYLGDYQLPISSNYYRDVEKGTKNLSIDKAMELIQFLPIDDPDEKHDLIYYVLSDLLGLEASKAVLKTRSEPLVENFADFFKTMAYDRKLHAKAYSTSLENIKNSYIPSDENIQYLNEHFDQLPLIHFAYLRDHFSKAELLEICNRNQIPKPKHTVKEFLNRFCAVCSKSENKNQYKRKRKIFRLSASDAGKNLKTKFILHETKKSRLMKTSIPFSSYGSFDYSMIMAFSDTALAKLHDVMVNLMAEIDTRNTDLEGNNMSKNKVMYISLQTSPRAEYSSSIDKNK